MAMFKDSGEKTDIFPQRTSVLDETGIQKYTEEFGEARATGYMEAMRDFNRELKYILGAGYTEGGVPKAGMKMRKAIITMFHTNDDLIDKFVSKHNSKSEPLI
jgi:hypothetical protein